MLRLLRHPWLLLLLMMMMICSERVQRGISSWLRRLTGLQLWLE